MPGFAIGLDISADFFTASCVSQDFTLIFYGIDFDQTVEGYDLFLQQLASHQIQPDALPVCMENTGVYSEHISHFLHEQGCCVYVEPAQFVKRSFQEREKDDDIDSRQIAEYYFRYRDKLHPWEPPREVTDTIKTLLTIREQFSSNRTRLKNVKKFLARKHHRRENLEQRFQVRIRELSREIHQLDQDLDAAIATNPMLKRKVDDVTSIGNVGPLLALNLLVITDGFSKNLDAAMLAKYIGIAPLKFQSGTSIKKRRKADGVGPTRMRKLLYLAAMRLKNNHPDYQKYYERKTAEGKNGKVILNNIANKLLRLICGILNTGKPYIKDYRSTKPEG